MKTHYKTILLFILFLLVCYVPLFVDLGVLPLRLWDESRLASNAWDMYLNGNYLVTTYNGEPDLWNTKPPLMIWCQVFFYHLLEPSTLATRLPSAFAALFTILALVYFAKKQFNSLNLGLISGLVLLTSSGYVGLHVTRTGDYDAMLTLWTSLYALLYFRHIHATEAVDKRRYLLLSMLCMVLAVLTKSIAGLLFLPALLCYTIYQKQLLLLLKNKWFYIGGVLMIIGITAYFFGREYASSGYLDAVLYNDAGRFSEVQNDRKGHFWMYFERLFTHRFVVWFPFIPLSGILIYKNKAFRDLFIYSLLIVVSFLTIISISKTKLFWYDAPVFPFLAIIVGMGIYTIAKIIATHFQKAAAYTFIIVLFFVPYKDIVKEIYQPKEWIHNTEFFGVSTYLRWMIHQKKKPKFTIAYHAHTTHIEFYTRILNNAGADIEIKDPAELDSTDTHVIASQKIVKDYIVENYKYQVLQEKIGFYSLKNRALITAKYLEKYHDVKGEYGATRYKISW